MKTKETLARGVLMVSPFDESFVDQEHMLSQKAIRIIIVLDVHFR